MNKVDIYKSFFETLYNKYNRKEYIPTDPILFPHTVTGDIEFIAFTAAIFGYGNVKAMQRFLTTFFEKYGTNPLKLTPDGSLKYRFQTTNDVDEYCRIMQNIYKEHGSLEKFFLSVGETELLPATTAAVKKIHTDYVNNPTHGLTFLFAIPAKSTSKRLHMFMRWMVRKDDVDLGLWGSFGKESLSMPMDTHIQRMATNMGIIADKENGVKALKKINDFFKLLTPADPVKYDFALTRLGIANGCKYSANDICNCCDIKKICVFQLT